MTHYFAGEVWLDARLAPGAEAKALRAFEEAKTAAGAGSFAALASGRLEELGGRDEEALALYSQALERDPSLRLASLALERDSSLRLASLARGALRSRLGDYDGALQDAEPLTKDPMQLTYARAMTLRAWARFQLSRDRVGALKDLDSALAADPVAPEALVYRAFVRGVLVRRRALVGGQQH